MARQFVYGLAVFVSSACGLVMEIVAGRLLAPYVGMSLYTWTAIIAVVLAGFSLGNWMGGRMAGPHVDGAGGLWRAAVALAFAAVSSLLSLVLLRALSGLLLASGLGLIPSIVLLAAALFLLPSLFVGLVSPILTKVAVDAAPTAAGRVIGRMYALSALGSIVGTLAAGYFFISWIGSTGTVIAVTAVYAAMALLLAIAHRLRAFLVGFLAVAGYAAGWWGNKVEAFTSPCQVESDYFCIRIADFSPESGRDSAAMVLDHLAHSINDRTDPTLLYSPYIHFVDEVTHLRLGGRAPDAFFIGGGGYSLPRAWAADFPGTRQVVAEIDPKVTAAARAHMWLPAQVPGLTVRHEDARTSLQGLPAEPTFHVVFGDAVHDISVPPHLVTREFQREVAARLRPDGFYAVNALDHGPDPRFLLALVRTMKLDFPTVEVWVEREQVGSPGRVTFIVLGARTPTPAPVIQARRGVQRAWLRWPVFDLDSRIAETGVPVLTDDFSPVDRLMANAILKAGD
jgi:spermidine synthase/MFS family permease